MTILLLPESWGKENVLRILNVWILNIDTTQKIILLIGEDPFISREEMAKLCRVTSDAIKAQIRKLRRSGRIRRIGPDKGDVGK
ncbi:winged helix-turn-helix transcriptional regulator [bacterium]|nr:winged helix-turn-helix transcriptional regulator [bacterium]